MEVFDYLNLAALIDHKILCVHGGLSPDISTIDQMRVIDRVQEVMFGFLVYSFEGLFWVRLTCLW